MRSENLNYLFCFAPIGGVSGVSFAVGIEIEADVNCQFPVLPLPRIVVVGESSYHVGEGLRQLLGACQAANAGGLGVQAQSVRSCRWDGNWCALGARV